MKVPVLILSALVPWAREFGKFEDQGNFSYSITRSGTTTRYSYEKLGDVEYNGSLDDFYAEVQQILNFSCRSFQLKPLRDYNSWKLERLLSSAPTGSTIDDAVDVIKDSRHVCEQCGMHYPTRLLCRAVYEGSFELAQKAIEWGAEVNEMDHFGSLNASILISASMLGRHKIVELLLKNGADVTAVNIAGANALINAVYSAGVPRNDSNFDKTVNTLLDYESSTEIDYVKCQPEYQEGSCYSEDILKMAKDNKLSGQTIARLQSLKKKNAN